MQKLDNDTIQYLKCVLILSDEEINDILLKVSSQSLNQTQLCHLMCELGLIENEIIGQKLIEESSQAEQFELQEIFEIYSRLKTFSQELDHQIAISQIVDAFVALGGNPDQSGSVSKTIFVNVVKQIFDNDLPLMETFNEEVKFPEFLSFLGRIGLEGAQVISAFLKLQI